MAEIGTAFLSIMASAKGLPGQIDKQVTPGLGGVGKRAGLTFGKAFGAIAVLGIGAKVAGFLGDSLGEAREAQKVGAQTTNVLKSMGLQGVVTAGKIGNFATSLSNATGVDDELIQTSENTLLTFGNLAKSAGVTGGAFQQATGLALDMSTALGTDLKGATVQIGKALNDPIKGITALSRSGVSFTEQQKKTIKSLVDGGKVGKAQGVILKELGNEFKGSAAAQATAGDKAAVAFGNIKEQVGNKLLPVVDSLAKAFLKSVPTITKLIDGIGPAFGRVQAFLSPFVAQVRGFFAGGGGGGFVSGVLSVANTLRANFLPALQAAANTFRTVILPAATSLGTYLLTSLKPVFDQVVSIITTRVIPIFGSLATFFYGTLYPAVARIVTQIAGSLKPVFDQIVATLKTQALPALDRLLQAFRRNQPAIQKVVLVVVKVVGAVLRLAAAILGKVLPPLIKLSGFMVGRVYGAVSKVIDIFGKVVTAISGAASAVGDFVTKVKDRIDRVKAIFEKLPGKITTAVAGFKDLLVHAGEELMNGLVRGIKNKAKAVAGAIKGIAGSIKDHLPGSPVKLGPLTSWNNGGAGERLMDLLAKGINKGETKVVGAVKRVLNKAKNQLDILTTAFQTVMDGVTSNFSGSLFSGFDTAGDFLANLTTTKGNLTALLGDFKTLKGFGLSGGFLAQLFADGGFPLIHELASNKDQASTAGGLFSDIQSLTTDLGNTVASGTTGVETTLKELLHQQKRTNQLLEKAPAETGRHTGNAVNGAATSGKQRGNKGGKSRR